MRRLIERGVALIFAVARTAPQRDMPCTPAPALCLARGLTDAWEPRDVLRHTGSKRMPVRTTLGLIRKHRRRHLDDHALTCNFKSTVQRRMRSSIEADVSPDCRAVWRQVDSLLGDPVGMRCGRRQRCQR
jgi:hypothetical protein